MLGMQKCGVFWAREVSPVCETDKYTNNDSNAISAVLEGCAGCHGNIEAAVFNCGWEWRG